MAKSPDSRKRGRPPLGEFENKTATLTTRITAELREALGNAAKGNGRSISQEVERRLRDSFDDKRILDRRERVQRPFGGPENYALFRLISMARQNVELVARKTWMDDPYTFEQVLSAATTIWGSFRPEGEAAAPTNMKFPADPATLGYSAAWGALSQVTLADPEIPLPRKGVRYSREATAASVIRRDLGKLTERLSGF